MKRPRPDRNEPDGGHKTGTYRRDRVAEGWIEGTEQKA